MAESPKDNLSLINEEPDKDESIIVSEKGASQEEHSLEIEDVSSEKTEAIAVRFSLIF